MKKYILGSLLAAALMISTASCDNGTEFSDAVFVTGTLTSQNVRFLIDGNSSSMGLTVTSSAKANNDIKVTLKPAPELLNTYNEKTGRNYQLPPEDAYTIDSEEQTIKAGSNQSTALKLTADGDKLKEGIGYCLPMTIASVGGDLSILETSRTAYIIFTKVINIKAANLGKRGGFDIKGFWGENSPVRELGQMTLEMKVLPVSFGKNPQSASSISSLVGCEENFLFRFCGGSGDVANRLQLAKGAIGTPLHPDKKQHYEATTDKEFETGQWLHFAAVYDGSSIRLYLDGEQFYMKETAGGTINLSMAYNGHSWNDGFAIGRSVGYQRYFDGYVSECRVWNVARTVDQLENGVCYVDPTSEGLIGYWRFNGEVQDDGTVLDETGHGYNATPFGTVTYVDNQKCPF